MSDYESSSEESENVVFQEHLLSKNTTSSHVINVENLPDEYISKGLQNFESYYRKLQILKNNYPLVPEIIPTSWLSKLESRILSLHNVDLLYKNKIQTCEILELSQEIKFHTDKNTSNILYSFTVVFIERNAQFSYVSSGILPEDYEQAAKILVNMPAMNPENWDNGIVDNDSTLAYEKTYHIIRYPIEKINNLFENRVLTWSLFVSSSPNCSASTSSTSSNSSPNSSANISANTTSSSSANLTSTEIQADTREQYQRKLLLLAKRIPCPELLPETNLSKLERWIIKQHDDNPYASPNEYSLFLLATAPIPILGLSSAGPAVAGSEEAQDFCIFNLCLRIGDRLIMSIFASLRTQAIESAVYDIMMNPMIFGTATENSSHKTVYITSVMDDNIHSTPTELYHGEPYLIMDKNMETVIGYGQYNSASNKVGDEVVTSYPRIHYDIGNKEVNIIPQKDLITYNLSKTSSDDEGKLNYTKVLFVPISSRDLTFGSAHVEFIRFSQVEMYGVIWFETKSKKTYMYNKDTDIFISENNQSYRVYALQ
jgi:hypothetical protein